MTDAPKDDNPREVKLYFRPSEITAIDAFRKKWWRKKSRNELFHVAIEYYMDRLQRSQGITGLNDFPVDVAAEEHVPYNRGEPSENKKGSRKTRFSSTSPSQAADSTRPAHPTWQ